MVIMILFALMLAGWALLKERQMKIALPTLKEEQIPVKVF
jgi:hypothetical protein